MDSPVVRCSATFLVLAYVSAILALILPVLYDVTLVAFLMALSTLLGEHAVERWHAHRRRARRRPLLAQWRPTYAHCF